MHKQDRARSVVREVRGETAEKNALGASVVPHRNEQIDTLTGGPLADDGGRVAIEQHSVCPGNKGHHLLKPCARVLGILRAHVGREARVLKPGFNHVHQCETTISKGLHANCGSKCGVTGGGAVEAAGDVCVSVGHGCRLREMGDRTGDGECDVVDVVEAARLEAECTAALFPHHERDPLPTTAEHTGHPGDVHLASPAIR